MKQRKVKRVFGFVEDQKAGNTDRKNDCRQDDCFDRRLELFRQKNRFAQEEIQRDHDKRIEQEPELTDVETLGLELKKQESFCLFIEDEIRP